MFIVLDNAESILDPNGSNAEEIYSVVDELCKFKSVCLCITSRITTVPPRCRRPEIPTLSMQAACDIFYRIYGDGRRSNTINDLLNRLDFHALSITLLATTASHNGWDHGRLVKEWDTQRVRVLQAYYNKSLATTIELSLASPTFRSLGPDGRDLLGVVAFFPQGIDEKNLDWLFPTVSNRKIIFDKFCVLSLTYRGNGFIRMLAPIRDYLAPQYPKSSPLLCTTRDHYFTRLSVDLNPGKPEFGETQWIISEDVNVEHLLDVFTSIDQNAVDVWDVCDRFMRHLRWHKPRQTILGSKIKALPDDHPSKPKCLLGLSWLLDRVGNFAEQKLLLTHTLELQRQRGDDYQVAQTLRRLCDVNRVISLPKEGIPQAKEALEIFKRTGATWEQMGCWTDLAFLFLEDGQLGAAEDAAYRAIDLTPERGEEFLVCQLHRVLGQIYRSKGEKKEAIHHFEAALRIASPQNFQALLARVHWDLAILFRDEGEFEDAHAHIKRAKSHTVDDPRQLASTIQLQATISYRQLRLEDAKSEILHSIEIFEKIGAVEDVEASREILQLVEHTAEDRSTSLQGGLLETMLLYPTAVNFVFLS